MALQRFQQYIDGVFCDAEDSFASINPATGEVWAEMPAASVADVHRAIIAAKRAFNDPLWSRMSPTMRGRLLYRLADVLAENSDRLADLETRDTGKIVRETRGQVAYVAEYYRYFAGLADKVQGAHLPIDKPNLDVTSRREPIGVVAAVVPWNSQFMLSAVKLGPALAAGNTVVLKASEDGPAPLLEFARLVHEAGFPPGVVNVVTGFGNTCGRALTSHPDVARVAFTGGPTTARHIVRNTAENLAMTSLELGGKSPVIVFEDADLDSATNAIIAGIFAASGQSCVAGSRLLVQRQLMEPMLERLQARVPKIRIGDPSDMATEMGPLATARQLDQVEALLKRSRVAGAKVIVGGRRPAGFEQGYFFEPTILVTEDRNSPAVLEEFFGPVLSVLPFDDEQDAITAANDTPYGLAAGIFTRDLARAHRISRAVRSGIVWVNTYRAVSPMAPFGGYGLSGYGREAGAEAILEYSRTKTVWINTSDDPIPDPFVMR